MGRAEVVLTQLLFWGEIIDKAVTMRWSFLFLVGLSIAFLGVIIQSKPLDINSREVQETAHWAVEELKSLSDSGVYSTIQLHSVLEADEDDGLFHKNTVLHLSLESPHFKSKKPVEDFAVVVMKHYEEKFATIAIDEFPEMDEAAIERFYEAKVERKRAERADALAKMEQEALQFEASRS